MKKQDPYYCSSYFKIRPSKIRRRIYLLLWLLFSGSFIVYGIINNSFGLYLSLLVFMGLPVHYLLAAYFLLQKYPNQLFVEKALKEIADTDHSIKIPPSWPNIEYPSKEIRKCLPYIGWSISHFYDSKYDVLDGFVWKKLQARNNSIERYWEKYPSLIPTVLEIQNILTDYCWAKKPVFAPEDDYRAIGQILTGDMSELETIMVMEETFGIEIPEDMTKTSMLDFVLFCHNEKNA